MFGVSLSPVRRLMGQPQLPHDKSISHRALMLAAVAHGRSALHHLARGQGVAHTREVLLALGAQIEPEDDSSVTWVTGRGPMGLAPSPKPLECGNSGTTMRLMMGLLAGLKLDATLVGDGSLSKRPMGRVAHPLAAMGARLTLAANETAPVLMDGGQGLVGTAHTLALHSGQVKGALLLAALHARGTTLLRGALGGRDHTERLLRAFGASLSEEPGCIALSGGQALVGTHVHVPQDFSAAAFWLCAGLMVDEADLTLAPVGLNPTRTGLLWALDEMGAQVQVTCEAGAPEPWGTLRVRRSQPECGLLRAITIRGARVAPMIDELPVLMVLATQAVGTTVIADAQELRVKESDRLEAMAENLTRMGARITLTTDGCTIGGPTKLTAAALRSYGDHRVAMALSVAAMVCDGASTLQGADCMAVSDPHFLEQRVALTAHPNKRTHDLKN